MKRSTLRFHPVLAAFLALSITAAAPVAAHAGWQKLKTGTSNTLNAVDFVDAATGWAAGYNGTIVKTIDGGKSWLPQNSTIFDQMDSIDFVDAATGWASGGPHILRTVNGGTTWATVSDTSAEYVHFFDAHNGVAFTGQDLLTTTNGGDTWSTHSLGVSAMVYLPGACFISPTTGWVVGQDTLVKTTDGGAHWTRENYGSHIELEWVDFADASHGLAGGNTTEGNRDYVRIFRTSDGGATWKSTRISRMSMPSSIRCVSAKTAYVVGAQILVTNDGGATWTKQWTSTGGSNASKWTDAVAMAVAGGARYVVGWNGSAMKWVSPARIVRSPSAATITVKRGHSFTLSASVYAPSGSALSTGTVYLRTSKNGRSGWKNSYRPTTDGAGAISKTFTPKKKQTVYYRWYVPSTSAYGAVSTKAQKVHVK